MEKKSRKKISIFDYFDYRQYLTAVYSKLKQARPGYSYRTFSSDAGITSSNYLFRVLAGQRHLSLDYVPKFCAALKLSQEESLYLETLVGFNNETAVEKKEQLLRKLLSLRCRRGQFRMEDAKLRFFSKWYYPVIRELVVMHDFKGDYHELARRCVPRVTPVQAKNSVAYLVKNGFIYKDKSGRYIYSEPVISSGDEVNSTILRNYHRETLAHCSDALDKFERDDRDISSLTLCVSKRTFTEIKREIQDFRKRLLALAKADTNPELVCLTGFQLIPRSKAAGTDRGGPEVVSG